jgi:DNA mismatch repair protein MSH4
MIQGQEFVANDAYASQTCRFQIVTGPNMSGKSTYLRQIALLCIMAQMGSLYVSTVYSYSVPAEYASFQILQQLFTRISVDDGIEFNASTFSSEMREMAFILQNVSRPSLVLVDELGRGTSATDGLAISLAICGALVESRVFLFEITLSAGNSVICHTFQRDCYGL